jgi:UDP-N-acetyl-D-mannosaminuronate dehydrogenase
MQPPCRSELASEINAKVTAFVIRKVAEALNQQHKAINGKR